MSANMLKCALLGKFLDSATANNIVIYGSYVRDYLVPLHIHLPVRDENADVCFWTKGDSSWSSFVQANTHLDFFLDNLRINNSREYRVHLMGHTICQGILYISPEPPVAELDIDITCVQHNSDAGFVLSAFRSQDSLDELFEQIKHRKFRINNPAIKDSGRDRRVAKLTRAGWSVVDSKPKTTPEDIRSSSRAQLIILTEAIKDELLDFENRRIPSSCNPVSEDIRTLRCQVQLLTEVLQRSLELMDK